jgi:septin family protein
MLAAADPEVSSSLAEDYTILFIGDKGSGKTTIVNKFLEKSEAIVASSVMEYSYGKRSKKNNNETRDVVHCWELGTVVLLLYSLNRKHYDHKYRATSSYARCNSNSPICKLHGNCICSGSV